MHEADLKDLVGRASSGDPYAFGEIYDLFARRVFALCRHMLGSREAAEDATSEVFLKARRALADMKAYDPQLPFGPWLFSVAGHYCVDQLRRRGLETRLFSASEEGHTTSLTSTPPDSPLQQLLAAESAESVRAALDRLPDQYRMALSLRYYSDLSYEQIAETMGLTRNHVATLIFRAKKQLRLALAPSGGNRSI